MQILLVVEIRRSQNSARFKRLTIRPGEDDVVLRTSRHLAGVLDDACHPLHRAARLLVLTAAVVVGQHPLVVDGHVLRYGELRRVRVRAV